VAGGWRRPHNEELHNLYTSPNMWTEQVSQTEGMRNAHKILVCKPEG